MIRALAAISAVPRQSLESRVLATPHIDSVGYITCRCRRTQGLASGLKKNYSLEKGGCFWILNLDCMLFVFAETNNRSRGVDKVDKLCGQEHRCGYMRRWRKNSKLEPMTACNFSHGRPFQRETKLSLIVLCFEYD